MSMHTPDLSPEPTRAYCYTRCTYEGCQDPTPRLVPVDVDAWICACCSSADFTAYLAPPYCVAEAKHAEFAQAFPAIPLVLEPLCLCEGTCNGVPEPEPVPDPEEVP